MTTWHKLNDWLYWRGISWEDLIAGNIALISLFAVIGILLGAAIT